MRRQKNPLPKGESGFCPVFTLQSRYPIPKSSGLRPETLRPSLLEGLPLDKYALYCLFAVIGMDFKNFSIFLRCG
jgi:hypothetical protein